MPIQTVEIPYLVCIFAHFYFKYMTVQAHYAQITIKSIWSIKAVVLKPFLKLSTKKL